MNNFLPNVYYINDENMNYYHFINSSLTWKRVLESHQGVKF